MKIGNHMRKDYWARGFRVSELVARKGLSRIKWVWGKVPVR